MKKKLTLSKETLKTLKVKTSLRTGAEAIETDGCDIVPSVNSCPTAPNLDPRLGNSKYRDACGLATIG
jgi:hypothetical protein